jgi:hypothetical protein
MSVGVGRIKRIKMNIIYLRFEAVPTMNDIDFEESGGALINCWIKEENEESAKTKAMHIIKENGWKIILLEESYLADDSMYNGRKSRKYYEQAKIDGEVYVYHTWPNVSQNDENIH